MFNYIKQRNEDLKRECRRQFRRMYVGGEAYDSGEYIRRAVNSPAPSYYVGYRHALRSVSAFLAGRLRPATTMRRRMVEELAARCRDLMARNYRLTLGQALARVLHAGNASSFFLSEKTAARIYHTRNA